MKRTIFLAALALVTLTLTAQKTITILNTNDTHSTIMPLSANLDDTLKAGRGGYIRRIALVKAERERDPQLLLFDSGDFSQGSPFYNLYKGGVEIGLMNAAGYTAATIGNHEFDFGLDNMARIFRQARFPIVCANYDFSGTVVEGLVKPYILIKCKGVKIGVFGLSPKLEGLVSTENYVGVKYLDPVATARQTAELLKKKEKCDVVICLSHLGWNLMPVDTDDEAMIAGSRYIDLVLGGHSHTYFNGLRYVRNLDGTEIPVDQNGKYAIYVGKTVLTVQNKK